MRCCVLSCVLLFLETRTSLASLVAVDDVITATKGDLVTFNILDNDFDLDGSSLSVLSVGNPSSGTFDVDHDSGVVTWTPPTGYYPYGHIVLTDYAATNAAGMVDRAFITIYVKSGRTGIPVAVPDVMRTLHTARSP